jgi:arsenate reductase
MTTHGADGESARSIASVYAALAQETRLEAYRLLLRYQPFGLTAGDIARLLAVPHNTLSGHLAILQEAELVRSRREGRTIIFAAERMRLAAADAFMTQGRSAKGGVQPIIRPSAYPIRRPELVGSDTPYNVLVLCTANSARSILAEAIINREGAGRFLAYSAGSQPSGVPNPYALDLLSSLGYDTAGLRSKSWTEFAEAGTPTMDFIITVCDSAAGEACPLWPGHPLTAHWGIPDPAAAGGTTAQIRAAVQDAYRQLMNRATAFVNLPIAELPLSDLKARLLEIARMDGATPLARRGEAA